MENRLSSSRFGLVAAFAAFVSFQALGGLTVSAAPPTADLFASGAANLEACRSGSMACGQCEPATLRNFDRVLGEAESGSLTSVESFIARMREIDPNLTNNFILIGDSKSLQGTSTGFPRVAFKSPESELWVTFNTDPNAPGYNTVEIIRWNGAAGRYDFQEVCFDIPTSPSGTGGRSCGGGGAGHGAASGPAPGTTGSTSTPRPGAHVRRDARSDCITCHREPARPNFDTYVAWAGFIPPRDDVLERGSAEAAEYMRVMRLAAAANDSNPPTSRFGLLTIPPADGVARLPSAEPDRSVSRLATDEQRLSYIESQINAGTEHNSAGENVFGGRLRGFRVPHVPPRNRLRNSDQATLPEAGLGHLAFDQSMAQQTCQIQTQLRGRPDYNQIKYAIAFAAACYPDRDSVTALMPLNARIRADDYFRASGLRPRPEDTTVGPVSLQCTTSGPSCPSGAETKICRLRCTGTGGGFRYQYGADCSEGWEPMPGSCTATGTGGYTASGGTARSSRGTAGELFNAVVDHTRLNQRLLDTHKADRHTRFLETSLGVSHADAVTGGERVRSVGEEYSQNLSALRYLLEPLGVPVSQWSMSYGDNLSIPSYTFADQLDILFGQRMFEEVRREFDSSTSRTGDYCQWLTSRSAAAFPTPGTPPPADPPSGRSLARQTYERIFTECGTRGRVSVGATVPDSVDAAARSSLEVAQATLRADGQRRMARCMVCHDDGMMVGAENVFPLTDPAATYPSRLKTFLGTMRGTGANRMTWLETITIATDHQSSEPGIRHMPPGSGLGAEDRAAFLGYLTSVELSPDGRGTGYACELVATEEIVGRLPAAAPTATGTPGALPAQ